MRISGVSIASFGDELLKIAGALQTSVLSSIKGPSMDTPANPIKNVKGLGLKTPSVNAPTAKLPVK